jgi:hypothetical protein
VTNHTRAVLSSLGGFLLGCVGGFVATPIEIPASTTTASL